MFAIRRDNIHLHLGQELEFRFCPDEWNSTIITIKRTNCFSVLKVSVLAPVMFNNITNLHFSVLGCN